MKFEQAKKIVAVEIYLGYTALISFGAVIGTLLWREIGWLTTKDIILYGGVITVIALIFSWGLTEIRRRSGFSDAMVKEN